MIFYLLFFTTYIVVLLSLFGYFLCTKMHERFKPVLAVGLFFLFCMCLVLSISKTELRAFCSKKTGKVDIEVITYCTDLPRKVKEKLIINYILKEK